MKIKIKEIVKVPCEQRENIFLYPLEEYEILKYESCTPFIGLLIKYEQDLVLVIYDKEKMELIEYF